MRRLLALCAVVLGVSAPASAGPITLVNHGFENGLTGWTTSGNVQALGPTSVVTFNDIEWAVSPNGGSMGALNSDGGAANSLDGFFGLPAGTLQSLNNAGYVGNEDGPGSLTNGSGIYQDFAGSAGDTVTMYFDYAARDYIPFNDPSFGLLVNLNNGFEAEVISSVWAGGLEVGTAGNSGWRPLTFTLPADGTYRIGFGVTNERDTVLDAALFLDDAPGTIDTGDLDPGESPIFPVLPDGNPLPNQFVFIDPTPGLWYDPPFAYSYTYDVTGGALFTEFQTPDASFGFGDLTFIDENGLNSSFTVVAGQPYSLSTPTSSFTIAGLPDGLIDFQAPNFSTAFPVFLNWSGVAGQLDITVTPHQQTTVPEPGTYALLTFGVSALVAVRRRRR